MAPGLAWLGIASAANCCRIDQPEAMANAAKFAALNSACRFPEREPDPKTNHLISKGYSLIRVFLVGLLQECGADSYMVRQETWR
jgi:hypothetical protein